MISKYDVLLSGACEVVSRYDYAYWQLFKKGKEFQFPLEVDLDYKRIIEFYGQEYIDKARSINNSNYQRYKRIKHRIEMYLDLGTCVFVTLTFTDEVLRSTNEVTRRKYVSRFLKAVSLHYVANIDYGGENGREHYHAVVLCDQIDDSWPYGFTWFEKVHKTGDKKKLAQYICKLTNHSLKATTRRSTYIFSKDIENIDFSKL